MKIFNFVVFDFETGGLDKKNQEHAKLVAPTQVAAIAVRSNDFTELGRLSHYIKPYDDKLEYQDQALKFTGVTMVKLRKEGIDVSEVVDNLIQLFTDCNTGTRIHKAVLVGHNVTYDIPFLQAIFKHCKKDLSKYVQGYKDHEGNFHPNYIDTMWLARLKDAAEGEKHNLLATAQREKVDLFDAHEAMNDVIATLEILKKYISYMRAQGDGASKDEVKEKRFRESFQL